MKKKLESKRSKEEKDCRALFDAVQGRLAEMRQCLKLHYMDRNIDEGEEDITHGLNKGLHDIEHIFWDLLFDQMPAKEILKNSPMRLGTRIIPIRYGG